jgi:hypothetical protein
MSDSIITTANATPIDLSQYRTVHRTNTPNPPFFDDPTMNVYIAKNGTIRAIKWKQVKQEDKVTARVMGTYTKKPYSYTEYTWTAMTEEEDDAATKLEEEKKKQYEELCRAINVLKEKYDVDLPFVYLQPENGEGVMDLLDFLEKQAHPEEYVVIRAHNTTTIYVVAKSGILSKHDW